MKNINKAKAIFYYLGLLLITISSTMVGRTYLFQIPHLNPALKYGALVSFLISFLSKRWRKRELIQSIAVILAILVVAIITDSNSLLMFILAIVLSRPGDFNQICRFLFWLNLILLVTVFGFCQIGLLADEISIHNGLTAHSLGFAYYNSPAYTVLFLTILAYYLFSGKKHTIKRVGFYIISGVANYLIYKLTTVRLTFYTYFILVALIIIYENLGLINKTLINKRIGTVMYFAMFVLSIFLPSVYTRSEALIRLDSFLNGRFHFSMLGFARYHINLFGNQIITSAGGFDENWHNTYFYIDSGYVKLLLGYGVIVCGITLVIYTLIARYAAMHDNPKLFVWCIVVCIFAFINEPLTDVIMNPLLFITATMFYELRHRKKTQLHSG